MIGWVYFIGHVERLFVQSRQDHECTGVLGKALRTACSSIVSHHCSIVYTSLLSHVKRHHLQLISAHVRHPRRHHAAQGPT